MQEIATVYHPSLETPIVLSPEWVQLLIVEDPHEFYRLVSMLDTQLGGGAGDFSFLREGAPISPDDEGWMICDPFHFDLNDKKVINLLIKRLASACRVGETQYMLSEINGKIEQFLYELFAAMPFSLTHEDLSAEELLKAGDVRFQKTYDTLTEKIVCFINAMVALKDCKFFVFVGLKGVLRDEDLGALYHHCAMEKVGLLLVESSESRPLLPQEKAIIITEDLCEILENYEEK